MHDMAFLVHPQYTHLCILVWLSVRVIKIITFEVINKNDTMGVTIKTIFIYQGRKPFDCTIICSNSIQRWTLSSPLLSTLDSVLYGMSLYSCCVPISFHMYVVHIHTYKAPDCFVYDKKEEWEVEWEGKQCICSNHSKMIVHVYKNQELQIDNYFTHYHLIY